MPRDVPSETPVAAKLDAARSTLTAHTHSHEEGRLVSQAARRRRTLGRGQPRRERGHPAGVLQGRAPVRPGHIQQAQQHDTCIDCMLSWPRLGPRFACLPKLADPCLPQTKVNEPKTPYHGPLGEEHMQDADDELQPLELDSAGHTSGSAGTSAAQPSVVAMGPPGTAAAGPPSPDEAIAAAAMEVDTEEPQAGSVGTAPATAETTHVAGPGPGLASDSLTAGPPRSDGADSGSTPAEADGEACGSGSGHAEGCAPSSSTSRRVGSWHAQLAAARPPPGAWARPGCSLRCTAKPCPCGPLVPLQVSAADGDEHADADEVQRRFEQVRVALTSSAQRAHADGLPGGTTRRVPWSPRSGGASTTTCVRRCCGRESCWSATRSGKRKGWRSRQRACLEWQAWRQRCQLGQGLTLVWKGLA